MLIAEASLLASQPRKWWRGKRDWAAFVLCNALKDPEPTIHNSAYFILSPLLPIREHGRRVFLPAVQASVGEPMRFHDLRHTRVAMLISQGEHPKVIQTRLRYSSINVTLDRYGHLFEGLDAGYR